MLAPVMIMSHWVPASPEKKASPTGSTPGITPSGSENVAARSSAIDAGGFAARSERPITFRLTASTQFGFGIEGAYQLTERVAVEAGLSAGPAGVTATIDTSGIIIFGIDDLKSCQDNDKHKGRPLPDIHQHDRDQ